VADEGMKGRGVDVGDDLSPTGCVCVSTSVFVSRPCFDVAGCTEARALSSCILGFQI
jgi:hypothetical protein